MRLLKQSIISAIVILFLFSIAAPVATRQPERVSRFQWPIERGKYPDLYGITSTFGESRSDHFHTGLDIAGINIDVAPVAKGRVLFNRRVADAPFQPTPGAGNYVILDHGKGNWSGYFHLQETTDQRRGKISIEDSLGRAGNTGHSYGAHLHFFITRDYGKTYINPLAVLPPITDNHPPYIGQLIVQTPESTTLISHGRQESIRLTRAYPFQVVINDPGLERYTRRGIYRMEWVLNGGAKQQRVFQEISYTDAGWMLDGKESYSDVFLDDIRVVSGMKYSLGKLQLENGDNVLQLTATDFAGNSTTATYHINVNREY